MNLKCASSYYIIPLALGLLTFASADHISLGDLGQLQGSIEPCSLEGMIQLRSPLASEPLLIKKDSIISLKFEGQKQVTKNQQIIHLKNGDLLPVETISFAHNQLSFISPWNSSHELNKTLIDSLALGSTDGDRIYSGPNPKEWTVSQGSECTNEAVRFPGSGIASWKLPKLPSRHIIGWTLESNADTNFKILIASDSDQPHATEKSGYSLSINDQRVQLIRNVKSGKSKVTLVNDQQILYEEKNNDTLVIELRVDQNNRILQLFINGESIRNSILDPEQTGEMPSDVNYHVICSGTGKKMSYLRKFFVSEWNYNDSSARSENRHTTKSDTLYDIDSNRYSGELVSINKEPEKIITFSNPHSPTPIEAPFQSTAILYFSGEMTKAEGSFIIHTVGSGTLHVTDYQLKDGVVNAKHAIMGDLSIPLTYVEVISRS
jgi:hypothetical protein